MASLTPRASGFWQDSTMTATNYFPDDDEDLEQQQRLVAGEDINDGRTPLDKTIDRIGMGSYQWTLLSLCGFGWMADNMWIQAVAIILPRVQQHYSVPDKYIGGVSSSMFAGMMVGAVGWGTCSDLLGRSAAFNATLFFTSLFGLLASFANSFSTLCIALFFLGSAVGGSMPTDGTLLLEHMPKGKQYLVTALSVFFSFGAVLSAVVALMVVPQNSCPISLLPCDVESQNQGWKYLLATLGIVTLSMFLARMVFFRLHESPRYLVHAGRPEDAIKSLQMISRFNGSDLSIELEDVDDRHPDTIIQPAEAQRVDEVRLRASSTTTFDASIIEDAPHIPQTRNSSTESQRSARNKLITQYSATGTSPPVHDNNASGLGSPTGLNLDEDNPDLKEISQADIEHSSFIDSRNPTGRGSGSSRLSRRLSSASRRSIYEKKAYRILPRWLRKPLWAWWDRVRMVLSPEWLRITILMWATWASMSLAYTMFNVFLPKLLEKGSDTAAPKTLEQSLWDVVIFTIGGCPGALLGAYLIESRLGRRWSLAGSAFITAFFCMVFVMVDSIWAVRASTVGVSLSATTMWAVLYGWTPEIFGTKVRGTACGIASALSRIGGMIAPILGGILLMMDRSFPVYTSVVIFAIAGCCVLLLREQNGDNAASKKNRTITH